VTSAEGSRLTRHRWTRRGLLRAGVVTAVAAPLAAPAIAACTAPSTPSGPDPLAALVTAAESDVRIAQAIAAAYPGNAATLKVVAAVRQQHADALRAEIDRANTALTTTSSPTGATTAAPAPTDEATAMSQLTGGLRSAQQQAASLVPTLPRYRAGLVGSVSAGCASVLEALGA
jgi:hypothetical protein